MSADVICLSKDSLLYANLTPNDPVFLSTPNGTDLLFLNFKFYARFVQLNLKVCQLLAKDGKLSLKFDKIYTY